MQFYVFTEDGDGDVKIMLVRCCPVVSPRRSPRKFGPSPCKFEALHCDLLGGAGHQDSGGRRRILDETQAALLASAALPPPRMRPLAESLRAHTCTAPLAGRLRLQTPAPPQPHDARKYGHDLRRAPPARQPLAPEEGDSRLQHRRAPTWQALPAPKEAGAHQDQRHPSALLAHGLLRAGLRRSRTCPARRLAHRHPYRPAVRAQRQRDAGSICGALRCGGGAKVPHRVLRPARSTFLAPRAHRGPLLPLHVDQRRLRALGQRDNRLHSRELEGVGSRGGWPPQWFHGLAALAAGESAVARPHSHACSVSRAQSLVLPVARSSSVVTRASRWWR